jgi:predicted RNase H-like HicB family nuclease
MKNKYEIIIYWSETDKVFIAEIPELKGCIAHGDTQNEALKEINTVAEEWLVMAKEKGWQIPKPKGRLTYA